jgi:hypothetical protein
MFVMLFVVRKNPAHDFGMQFFISSQQAGFLSLSTKDLQENDFLKPFHPTQVVAIILVTGNTPRYF